MPTEEEWEAAARGPDGEKFPWGDQWRDGICNTAELKLRMTTPVGLFPRSRSKAYGLDDAAGNVWEWCNSLYEKDEQWRVLRGGAWFSESRYERCAFRDWYYPSSRLNCVGFRMVL